MREHEPFHAPLLRFLENLPGLRDVEVAARQRHVVSGDDVEDFLHLVPRLFVGVEHGNGRGWTDFLRGIHALSGLRRTNHRAGSDTRASEHGEAQTRIMLGKRPACRAE